MVQDIFHVEATVLDNCVEARSVALKKQGNNEASTSACPNGPLSGVLARMPSGAHASPDCELGLLKEGLQRDFTYSAKLCSGKIDAYRGVTGDDALGQWQRSEW